MSENFLPDFLGGEPVSEEAAASSETIVAQPAAEAAPAADAPAAEPEAQAEGQARGPDGKFLPAIVAESAVEAAPAAEAPVQAEPHQVPVTALLDERDKRQGLERDLAAANLRAQQLQQWRDQQEAQARAQPVKSREEDPDGWEQRRETQFQQALRDQGLMTSRAIAEVKYGEDVAKRAYEWGFERCATDPYFNAKVGASPDPMSIVVAEWKQAQLLARIDPTELDAFQAWKAAQAAAPAQGITPQPPPAPSAAPVAPRPSLAAGPTAGRADLAQPGDGEAVFDGMFRK
jgi:hypothetical protein